MKKTNMENNVAMKFDDLRKIKCDLFSKDPALRERVADYMQKKVWGITLRTRCKTEIAKCEQGILALQKLEGSIRQDSARESINELKIQILNLQDKLAKTLAEEATFAYSDADNEFYKSYKNASTQAQLYTAIVTWFDSYGFDVSKDASFVFMIINAISGERKANSSTIIRSEGQLFTLAKRSKGDVMYIFYGKVAEFMLAKGVLKPTVIPEDVREYYAPKKAKKNK